MEPPHAYLTCSDVFLSCPRDGISRGWLNTKWVSMSEDCQSFWAASLWEIHFLWSKSCFVSETSHPVSLKHSFLSFFISCCALQASACFFTLDNIVMLLSYFYAPTLIHHFLKYRLKSARDNMFTVYGVDFPVIALSVFASLLLTSGFPFPSHSLLIRETLMLCSCCQQEPLALFRPTAKKIPHFSWLLSRPITLHI